MSHWSVRRMQDGEIDALITVWHDAWHEAHAPHVPAPLTAIRTPDSFAERLAGFDDGLRVIGPVGAPVGLCVVQQDQLYQIYLSPAARGTGAAAALMADAERRLSANGVHRAWLDCIVENARAIRFYTRQGWTDSGDETVLVDGLGGKFPLKVRIFRKNLNS